MLAQRAQHGQQRGVRQERQPPGAEVVQQRAERLRPDCHPIIQPPRAVQVEP